MSEWQSLDNLTWNGPAAIQQHEQVATLRKEEVRKRRRWCRMPLNCQCWQLLFIVPNDVIGSSPDNRCLIHVSPLLLLFLWYFINNEPCHCSPYWMAVLFQVCVVIDLRYLYWQFSVRTIWCVSQAGRLEWREVAYHVLCSRMSVIHKCGQFLGPSFLLSLLFSFRSWTVSNDQMFYAIML